MKICTERPPRRNVVCPRTAMSPSHENRLRHLEPAARQEGSVHRTRDQGADAAWPRYPDRTHLSEGRGIARGCQTPLKTCRLRTLALGRHREGGHKTYLEVARQGCRGPAVPVWKSECRRSPEKPGRVYGGALAGGPRADLESRPHTRSLVHGAGH